MGIDVLQALRELIVKTVYETDDAPTNSNNPVLLFCGRPFDKLVVIGDRFFDRICGIRSYNADQLVHLPLSREPKINGHMCSDGGIVVKPCGYKGQKNPDPLVFSDSNLQQFLQDANLFRSISVLDSRQQTKDEDKVNLPSFLELPVLAASF